MASRSTPPSPSTIPAHLQWSVMLLRVLCILPAFIGGYSHLTFSPNVSSPEVAGLFGDKSTPLLHKVALFWCSLAGYWCWILITSMLNRWFRYYESSSAMVRLITLTMIIWSIFAYVSSNVSIDQPIWKWMTICFILFVSNILKVTFAANNHKTKEEKDEYKSTFVRVLILPLTVVVFITMFVLLYQVGKMRRAVKQQQQQYQQHQERDNSLLPPEAHVRVLVLIVSAWASTDKRQVFRETTLKLMPTTTTKNEHIAYVYRFVIGQSPTNDPQAHAERVSQEMDMYGDVLMLNCSDSRHDLSRKVYSAYEWADHYDFDYLIKTEDDVFVRWDTISKELELAGRIQRYWRGFVYWNIPPIRNKNNGELVYPLPILPPYTAGSLYIVSRDIVHLVAGVSGPRMFITKEDQNLGIWLFPFNIMPIHDRRIQQIDVCENDMIGKHFGDFSEPDATGGTMYDMLNNLVSGRKMCYGFKMSVCGMCYPCHGKSNHWRDWGFDCDDKKGITLLNSPQLTIVE